MARSYGKDRTVAVRLSYRILNVFARGGERLSGNPLCVFEDGRGLDAAAMQALALQFNLSETTFILPSAHADARVRIFTPGYEMPFAGHPTLGTAHVVRSLLHCGDRLRLETSAGVIPVRASGDLWELRANPATARRPLATTAGLASALGLAEHDIAGEALWVDSGSEQLIVPLAGADAVRRARVAVGALREVTADGPRAQAYVFARVDDGCALARFFFTKDESVLEDPATGSATANLGGWYLATGTVLPLAIDIAQGEQTGRPSALHLRIDADGGVFVAGEVIELGRGFVEL